MFFIRRFIVNPIRRKLGLPVHYRMRARTGHFGVGVFASRHAGRD